MYKRLNVRNYFVATQSTQISVSPRLYINTNNEFEVQNKHVCLHAVMALHYFRSPAIIFHYRIIIVTNWTWYIRAKLILTECQQFELRCNTERRSWAIACVLISAVHTLNSEVFHVFKFTRTFLSLPVLLTTAACWRTPDFSLI